MQQHKLVIITDQNRRALRVFYTENLMELLRSLPENEGFVSSPCIDRTYYRVIYQETFNSPLSALDRYNALRNFTRMQLERLVRRFNPNWLNLYPVHWTNFQKKAALGTLSTSDGSPNHSTLKH